MLVRGSVDAPVGDDGKVCDDFRLRSFLPTVKHLLANHNKVIICGKRGRAKGKVNKELSLKLAAECLANLLGFKILETDHKLPDYPIPHLIFYTGDFREEKHQEQLSVAPERM